MSERGYLAQGIDYGPNGAVGSAGILPGRGLVVGDWLTSMVARGLGWNVSIGAISTPITGGGAGTLIDPEQPEGVLSVPSGYCLVPLRIAVECAIGLQTTDSHVNQILLAVDRAAAWPQTGTRTDETPFNLRTDLGSSGCPIVCASAFTADTTTPTLSLELAHKEALTDVQGTPATLNVYQFDLVYEPRTPPFIVGPAALYIYWGGSIALSGYAQADFLAFESSLVTSLT